MKKTLRLNPYSNGIYSMSLVAINVGLTFKGS